MCLLAANKILNENVKAKDYFSNLNSSMLLGEVSREFFFVNFRSKEESTVFSLFCISHHACFLLRALSHTSNAWF